MELREETYLIKGTSLYHRIYGHCRLKWVWPDKFCFIIDNKEKPKKLGATADAYGRIVDGKLFEWNANEEITVLGKNE